VCIQPFPGFTHRSVLLKLSVDATVQETLKGNLGLNGSDISPVMYPFLASNDIWRHDKAQTADGFDDWFGEVVARPDFVLSDLKEIISPGTVPNHKFRYFRNFSKAENVTMSGPGACKDFTCDAYDQQQPLTAGMSGAADSKTTGPGGVKQDGSPAARALVAGVVTVVAILAALV
jgi:hypothetical protein